MHCYFFIRVNKLFNKKIDVNTSRFSFQLIKLLLQDNAILSGGQPAEKKHVNKLLTWVPSKNLIVT